MSSAQSTPARRGSWAHRFLVHLFTGAFAVLTYWLLGFVIDDIGNWPGPDYAEVEQRLLDQTLVAKSRDQQEKAAGIQRQMTNAKARQEILRDSTLNLQKTINQLLDIQRIELQKGVTATADEMKSLAESQRLFLSDQKRYQGLNEEIAGLNEQSQDIEEQRRQLDDNLEKLRVPVRSEYDRLVELHNLKMASIKLATLVPLLLLAFVMFLKWRGGIYAVLIYAFGGAVMLKIALVMHEYFPTRYFKYVLILACLAVVLRILLYLLKMIAHPKRDWLLKQYREAYETFFCPICDYPIRRGPRKYLFWTRRSIRKLQIPVMQPSEIEQPYTCPMCGSMLFEECGSCHAVRHSLLPACEKCGAEKSPTPAARE